MGDEGQSLPKKSRSFLKPTILICVGLVIGIILGMIIGPTIFADEEPPDATIIVSLDSRLATTSSVNYEVYFNGELFKEGNMASDTNALVTIPVHYPEGAVEGQQIISVFNADTDYQTWGSTVQTELGGNYQITVLVY